MTATLVLLTAALAAPPGPLPDGKSFDAFTYAFGAGGLGPGGAFGIAADGKVSYFYSSAPHTGSGGHIVKKEWTLTKEEKAELFSKLLEAGLLELPEGHGVPYANGFLVSSGKWRLHLSSVKVPDKVMALLRPLLTKAHPELWAEKPEPKPAKPEPVVLKSVSYTFTPKADGEIVSLYIQQNGVMRYTRQGGRDAPAGALYAVVKEWKITAKELEALLGELATDGLFDLEDTGGGKYPSHTISAYAGRWQTTFHPKELPEKVSKHLMPLLKKADAEFWK
jgi:hypothetical protein